MANLGEGFNPNGPEDFISAIEELRARDQWVGWKLVMRAGARKPTKPPVNPHNGFAASHSKPSTWGSYKQAQSAVKRYGLAGVGYVLSDDDDYTGVDLDKCRNAETGEIEDWAKEVIAFAETYTEISPSGTGVRMFVRGKIDKAVKCDVARVEIYGAQRYLTITNNHVEGTPLDIREAPKTLAALTARAEAMAPKREGRPEPERQRSTHSAPRSNETGARAWAAAALDGKATELASLGEGGRNHALNASAYSMGTMIARGWIDEPTVRAKLEDACRANGLWKDDGPFGVRATMSSGLRSGMANPHPDLPEREDSPEDQDALRRGDEIAAKRINDRGETPEDQQTTEEEQEEPVDARRESEVPFPEHLTTKLPGLLGEISDWVYGTSRQPSRVVSLAVAISVIGTCAGRAFAGPSDSGTHLYIALLGITGGGKGHTHDSVQRLLNEALLHDYIGPGRFTSQNALEAHLKERAVSVCLIDEIGDAISKFHNPRASENLKGMADAIMTLWNINMGIYTTTRYAAVAGTKIKAPSLSILGLSTAEKFWAAFQGADIGSGFLNRFTILTLPKKRMRKQTPRLGSVHSSPIPQSITEGLLKLRGGGCPNHEWVDAFQAGNSTKFQTTTMAWAPEVAAMWTAHEDWIHEQIDRYPERDPFYARTAEMALRLAAIRALAIGSLEVTREDMEWGREIADWSALAMMRGARLFMAGNDFQARMNNILRIVIETGGCDRRTIAARVKDRPKELDEAIQGLKDAGHIVESVKKGKAGPTGRWFKPGSALD